MVTSEEEQALGIFVRLFRLVPSAAFCGMA